MVSDFAGATATRFERHWKHVIATGDCAIVAVTLTIDLDLCDNSIKVPIRWTVSLVQRAGEWKWLHHHAFATAGSQDEARPTRSTIEFPASPGRVPSFRCRFLLWPIGTSWCMSNRYD